MGKILEICVDSLASARNAIAEGANRLELCSALSVGGLTPYTALLRQIREASDIPVRCLMRPRPGDFLYAPEELDMLKMQISELRQAGADGFVIGCLNADGTLDKKAMKFLMEACLGCGITLHRCIDVSCDPVQTYLGAERNRKVQHVLSILNRSFHSYISGQCLEALILGLLCFAGMLIFRFPYAAMVSALVGCTALIPVAGAYIGAIVGAFMIFTVSPIKSLLFLLYLIVLQQIEGNLIFPRVVGQSIGLPGVWVLAAVTIGGGLFGIAGMLIGVPLAASLYQLLREDVQRREDLRDSVSAHAPEA